MVDSFFLKNWRFSAQNTRRLVLAIAVALALPCAAVRVSAQDQSQPQTQSQTPPQTEDNGKPKQEAPADAGGPGGDIGPYAIPKRKTEDAPPPPPPPTPKKVEGMPDYSIRVNAPLVNVDVLVTTKSGQFVPNLKQDNFRLFEDGAPQAISSFNVSKAPITAVLLVEFASTTYSFIIDALEASYAFANTLQKDDWVAVESYDMQPHLLVDFTQDKRAVYGALNQLRFPGFAETNLFDALYDTLDRLDRVQGKKYIILVTTGYDSFSKLTLDKITKKVKDTKDVTIFPISVGQIARNSWAGLGAVAWAFTPAKWIIFRPITPCAISPRSRAAAPTSPASRPNTEKSSGISETTFATSIRLPIAPRTTSWMALIGS